MGTSLTDDFLKKIKQQHENLKQNDQRVSGAKMNDTEMIRQQLGQLSLQINSPKYAGKD
jgi:hypothetical protein